MQGRVFGVSPPAENVQGSVRSNEGFSVCVRTDLFSGKK